MASALALLIFIGWLSLSYGDKLDYGTYSDLAKYTRQVKILHENLLEENCPDPIIDDIIKRNILGGSFQYELSVQVQKKLYRQLFDLLVECKKGKLASITTPSAAKPTTANPSTVVTLTTAHKTTSKMIQTTKMTSRKLTSSTAQTPTLTTTTKTTPATTTSTTPTTTQTTTVPTKPSTTTTLTPRPAMCLSAINLTESWRKDDKGSNIRPKNGKSNCDTREMIAAGRPWFRFSGAAGNRLRNKCVPRFSCGTNVAFWSDDPMPTQVGVITQVNVYAEVNGNCRHRNWTERISVVRCSTSDNDYVYRYDGSGSCNDGFCGMSA